VRSFSRVHNITLAVSASKLTQIIVRFISNNVPNAQIPPYCRVELMTGKQVKRVDLKGISEEIGLSYNTAKKGQSKNGSKKRWLIGDFIWEVWLEEIR